MIASERERCACRRLTPHHRHIDAGRPGLDDFDGFAWAEWTSHHWEIPITACVVYLVGIFLLKRFMAERKRQAHVAQVARTTVRLRLRLRLRALGWVLRL